MTLYHILVEIEKVASHAMGPLCSMQRLWQTSSPEEASYSSQASCLAPGFPHLPTEQKHDPNLNLSPTWLEDMRARVVAKARD